MNARELSCVAQIVFERSENKEGYSDETNKILILCYYDQSRCIPIKCSKCSLQNKKQISKPKNSGAHGVGAYCNTPLPGDCGKAGSRVSLERGGKPTRAVLTASNILNHDAGH